MGYPVQFGNAEKFKQIFNNYFPIIQYLYSTYYTIGSHLYSLQSIFNGILRGNRIGIGMLWKAFGEQDYRKEVCHFISLNRILKF